MKPQRESDFEGAWREVEAFGYGLEPGPAGMVGIVALPRVAQADMRPLSIPKAHLLFLAENLRQNQRPAEPKSIAAKA